MNAEIISTGTELLLGHTINTDASLIARELAALGINLYYIHTVGDNSARMEKTLREALARSDLVIMSGGLGPTPDDLSRDTAAKVSGKKLVPDENTLRKLQNYFAGREMSANQAKQALFPEGAHIFENKVGTAPGCAVEFDGKAIILLPGPPAELAPMLENEARPWLEKRSKGAIVSRIIRTFGIGEGSAAAMLGNLLHKANPTVATYAGDGEMHVKITARAGNATLAKEILEPAEKEALQILGEYSYGFDSDNLASKVVDLLKQRKILLACAESCTGGWLAQHITSCPGSSEVFQLGVVSYSNSAKEKILGLSHETLEKYGAVSPETALGMAKGIKELSGSQLGIGITGIAGPDGGTREKPLGLVYICLLADGKEHISMLEPRPVWLGRDKTRLRAIKAALDMTRRFLTGLPLPETY